jgi:integrase
LLVSLKSQDFGKDEHGSCLFPRFWEWDIGQQAQVLRMFCIEIGVPSVRFHTLRACFATHLISRGVPSATIMKICGWKELKTMERYVRLAGIDERGATEGLGFIPTDQGIMENVVRMFEFRK